MSSLIYSTEVNKRDVRAMLRDCIVRSCRDFCIDLLKETGVMVTPGSALGVEGYVRLGYANNPTIIQEGLKRFGAYLQKLA